jgi:carbonic anhydrase
MCEINVIRQVSNLSRSKIVQTAWQRGQQLHVHGWIYSVNDGVIHDLKVDRKGLKDEEDIYEPDNDQAQ